MTMSPATPLAGMDIAFEIKGLRPSEWIEVTFIDPAGQESRWVTDEDLSGSWATQFLRADARGHSRWVRYGTQDQPGKWSVRIKHGGSTAVINYQIDRMRLSKRHRIDLGVVLTGCRSEQADIFFSDSVNFAMTVGMHGQLDLAVEVLEERLGVRSSKVPLIHLLGNKEELDEASRATGGEPGWEAGFFRSWGDNPGIYMHTDDSLTDIYNTLTHEYAHFAMYEAAVGKTLPAWLSEGLAGYYEYEVGLLGERPQATVLRMLRSADRAQEAAAAGNLFTLYELESRRFWNSRPAGERVSLQYSQAYMLARYVAETFGEKALLEMARSIGQGADVSSAVLAATGVAYPELEQDFITWLLGWDDPVREEARPYVQLVDRLMAERNAIADRREELVKEWNLRFDRAASEQAMTPLVEEAEGHLRQLDEAPVPASLEDLHKAAVTYFGAYRDFLNEDLKFFSTGQRTPDEKDRKLRSMLGIWGNALRSLLGDTKFVLNLD